MLGFFFFFPPLKAQMLLCPFRRLQKSQITALFYWKSSFSSVLNFIQSEPQQARFSFEGEQSI